MISYLYESKYILKHFTDLIPGNVIQCIFVFFLNVIGKWISSTKNPVAFILKHINGVVAESSDVMKIVNINAKAVSDMMQTLQTVDISHIPQGKLLPS